ncbi:PaaI family thioesterase [Gemmatimonas sp.]|jgi:1,4-dihydroxy-2-naphthoyl-CoA hydrolase|uniref:PaaI family thioesterase n=1 Tax=Gemmatimonas sp. TaxID=1962908 RepID=UPI0037C15626
MMNAEQANARAKGFFPSHIGMHFTHVAHGEIHAECEVRRELMAPNGYLHAGAVVTFADSCAGFGCMATLPDGADGFTTVELKTNHLGTTRDGTILCQAVVAHTGRTTQVWDAVVTHKESGRTLALFRCTQMILYPRTTGVAQS